MSEHGSIAPRIPPEMFKRLSGKSEKVVFLNDKNLELLKGYKAYVEMSQQGEIHIIITGLSSHRSKILFDSLMGMNETEIIGDKK